MSKFCTKSSLGLKDYSQASISLSDDQRAEIKTICRRRKVDALAWKRARAIGLLDAGADPETICQILDIGRIVLTGWRSAFSAEGCAFFRLNDYSQREGHLTFAQEEALKSTSPNIRISRLVRSAPTFWRSIARTTAPRGLLSS